MRASRAPWRLAPFLALVQATAGAAADRLHQIELRSVRGAVVGQAGDGEPHPLVRGEQLRGRVDLVGGAGARLEFGWTRERASRSRATWEVVAIGPFRLELRPEMQGLGWAEDEPVEVLPGMVFHHGVVELDSRDGGRSMNRVIRLEPGVELGASWVQGRLEYQPGEEVLRFELKRGSVDHWRHPPGLVFFEGAAGETEWHSTCRLEYRKEVVHGEPVWFYQTAYRMTRHRVRTPRRLEQAIPRARPPGGPPSPPPPMPSRWINRIPAQPVMAIAPPTPTASPRRPASRSPPTRARPPPPPPTETPEETHEAIENMFGF